MTAEIVKLPYSVFRRVVASRPRRSKNGTPEERAAKAAAGLSGKTAPVIDIVDKATARRAAAKAAAPEAIVATPYKRNSDVHAALRRAAEIVRALGERHVRDDWAFDKARASRFLESMCTLDPKDGDGEEMTTILEWVSDHGQSLDWIFCGDPSVMICHLASTVTATTKRAKPKLLVITPDEPPTPGAA
jgi:hypothetical protein